MNEAAVAALKLLQLELSPVDGVIYRAFVDAAGGGPDSYTISIGHKEGDVYIIDVVRGTSGKFDPQSVTENTPSCAGSIAFAA